MSEREIKAAYGEHGITAYDYEQNSRLALISDDTQMTLFTANGLLYGDTRHRCRGIGAMPRAYEVWRFL